MFNIKKKVLGCGKARCYISTPLYLIQRTQHGYRKLSNVEVWHKYCTKNIIPAEYYAVLLQTVESGTNTPNYYMNSNQNYALFVFNLLSYLNSICFRHINRPSSGGKRQGRPLGGASGALAQGVNFEGAPKKAVTDWPHVNT
jgi:hypothetical protein